MKKEIEIDTDKKNKKKKYKLKQSWIEENGKKVLIVKKESVNNL
jgi:hypothetical protein